MIEVVLISPKIPSNTGNIIRLCANTGARLHLVKPLGFDMEDKKLRRAGLDYHEWVNVEIHDDWQMAKQALYALQVDRMVALTTKLSQSFYQQNFAKHQNVALIFGSETTGLSQDIRLDIGEHNWLRLPMLPDSRSLNLSNSVAIALYEVWRQQNFVGDIGASIGYQTV